MLKRLGLHLDDMVVAVLIWLCTLPLVGLLVVPFFGLKTAIVVTVAVVLWLFHFRFLSERRWGILLNTLLVSAYALPLDAWGVARGWGGFNPAYVSGI